MYHLFLKKNQLIIIFLKFISKYKGDIYKKKIIFSYDEERNERKEFIHWVSQFCMKLGGSNTVPKQKYSPLSPSFLKTKTITHLQNDSNRELLCAECVKHLNETHRAQGKGDSDAERSD